MQRLFNTKNHVLRLDGPTVRRIVEQHGGGVEISSSEGRGPTVEARLSLSNQEKEGAS